VLKKVGKKKAQKRVINKVMPVKKELCYLDGKCLLSETDGSPYAHKINSKYFQESGKPLENRKNMNREDSLLRNFVVMLKRLHRVVASSKIDLL